MGETYSKSTNDYHNNPYIQDLQTMAADWAWDNLAQYPVRKTGLFAHLCNYKTSELQLSFKWDRLQVKQGQVVYEEFDDGAEKSYNQVMMKSHFTNNSHIEQVNHFKVTKSLECSIKTTLEKGLCVGNRSKIRLLIPEEIQMETSEFGRQFCITKVPGWEDSRDVDWSVDHDVKVPPYSTICAEHIVVEKDISAWFNVPVTVLGNVNIMVSDARTKNIVKVLKVSVCQIVQHAIISRPISEPVGIHGNVLVYKADYSTNIENNVHCNISQGSVNFVAKGYCRFRYGVEQFVKLSGTSQL